MRSRSLRAASLAATALAVAVAVAACDAIETAPPNHADARASFALSEVVVTQPCDSAHAAWTLAQTDTLWTNLPATMEKYATIGRIVSRIDSAARARLCLAPVPPDTVPSDTTPSDTTPVPPPPPPPTDTASPPPPVPPSSGVDTAKMRVLTDRSWATKAATTTDKAGAQGWDPIEGKYFNLTVQSDASAPSGDGKVAVMTYPKDMKAGTAPGMAQIASNRWQGGGYVNAMYVALWVKLSPNFYGNISGTNKRFFVWVQHNNPTLASKMGARVFLSAEGQKSGPLVPQIRLQGAGIPDTRPRLVPNVVPGAVIQRGVWQKWELLFVMNTPGQMNGRAAWWIDGKLVTDYHDVGYVAGNETPYFAQYQWSPTFGGGGEVAPWTFEERVDRVLILGR